MLNVANEGLMSSLLKADQTRADLMRRTEMALEQKDEELKAALAREEMLKKDSESVSALKQELKDSQGQLRCCMEQKKKIQVRADRQATEIQELTSATDLSNSKITRLVEEIQELTSAVGISNSKTTRLAEENAELTRELEKAVQTSQDFAKLEVEDARSYYQGVVEEAIKKYYLEGKVQGHKECMEEYGIVEPPEADSSDEDTQAIATIFPSLAQQPLATASGDIAQTSEAALVQTTPVADNLASAADPVLAEENPAPAAQDAAPVVDITSLDA